MNIEDEELFTKLGLEIPETISKVANYDPLGPKLLIHKIENNNFKSYYGKRVLGPFHKNFTAIIGPNGSGKSNIIDSMLFVFGFRASKIRSKKISVLIHNSSKHQNINSCNVKVFFRKIIDTALTNVEKKVDENGQLNEEVNEKRDANHSSDVNAEFENDLHVIPNTEFVISRTAFKDNSSYYCINEKKATFKDISDLLKSHGIDLDHNRFLILQGEVEQISLMKPKAANENEDGMVEFLEDIIGSNRYKPALAKLTLSLEEESERRTGKLVRFRTAEKDLKALEGPRDAAALYLNLENRCIRHKNAISQLGQYVREKELEEKQRKFGEIDKMLKEINETLASSETSKREIDKDYKIKYKEYESCVKGMEDSKKALNDLEIADAKIRENYKHLTTKNKELVKTVETEHEKIEENKATFERNAQFLGLHVTRMNELTAANVSAEAELQKVTESLKNSTKDLCSKKDTLERQLMDQIDTEFNQAKSQLEKAKAELNLYTEKYENRRLKIKEIEEKLKALQNSEDEAKRKLKDLMEDVLPGLEKQAIDYKNKIDKMHENEKQIESKLKECRAQIRELTQNIAEHSTGENNDLMGGGQQQRRSGSTGNPNAPSIKQNKVVRALMEAQERREINGVYGRLGDLGTIDQTYDIALSSSCGSTLDNVLVRDENAAQGCVAILKALKLPPTTFICANQIEAQNQPPAQVHGLNARFRLYDKIKPISPNFKSAFYFAVRETLFANDLDQATTLAYPPIGRRNRVVTLGGDVFELSGTLSGGGSRPLNGKMSNKLTVKYDTKLDKVIYPFMEAGQSKEQELAQKKAEKELEQKLAKWEADLKTLEKQCETLISESGELRTARLEAETRLRNLNTESLNQARYNKEKLTMDLQNFELQISTLRVQHDEMVEESRREGSPTKSGAGQSASTMDIAKVSAMNKEIARLQGVHDKKQAASQALKADIDKINDQIKAITDRTVKGPRTKLNEIKTELDKLTKENNKLKLENESLKKNIATTEARIKKGEKEMEKNRETIETYKLRMKEMEQEATSIFNKIEELQNNQKALKINLDKLKIQVDELEKQENETKSRLITIKNDHKTQLEMLEFIRVEINRLKIERSKLKLNRIPKSCEELLGNNVNEGLTDQMLGDQETENENLENLLENEHHLVEEMEDAEQGQPNGAMEVDDGNHGERRSQSRSPSGRKRQRVDLLKSGPPLKTYARPELEKLDGEGIRRELKALQAELAKMKQPDLSVLKDYEDKEQQFLTQAKELEEITEYRRSLQELYNKLKKERLTQFLSGFTFITVKLKEIYRMITLGGDADLELVDSLDPFIEGVAFRVRPLNKSWKTVNNLSGGEKTLSSIALIFALHHYKPTPFYVMDEIDAALDFKNVSIVAHYIKQRTQTAQFIIISLRHNMFELADRLIGIYKTHDCTENVVLQSQNMVEAILTH